MFNSIPVLLSRDTSFDFDFDGGLNALSKFNVDMSDLDLPRSHDKTVRIKDSSQDKQRGESKFSFQFNGFDELDLDDTLKTNKETETPVYLKKVKRNLSPPSTASKYCKKGLLDSFSEDASESTSTALASTSLNKESHKNWKGEPAVHQGKPSGGLTFSHDENSMHERGLPLQDMQEQASRKSEDDRIKTRVEEPSKPDVESSKRFSNEMEAKVLSSENETQELPAEKDSLATMHSEEQTTRVYLDEVPQMKESSKVSCSENLILGILEENSKNEETEQQKCLMSNVGPSANTCFSPKHLNEPHTVHTNLSPQASAGRSAKRKFSEEQGTSDSPVPKQNSSKKQEVDEISAKTEEQQASDSATSQRKCKDIHTSPGKNHHDTPLLGKTASKLVADRFLQGVTSLNKMIKPSLLRAPSSLIQPREKHSKFQGHTASVEVKSPFTSSPNIAAKTPTMLGGLRSQSLLSTAHQKRSLYQLNAAKDLSNTTFQGKSRPEKQLESLMLRKTSSVAVLSKNKATGALRDSCEKAFKFDVAPSSKSTVTLPTSTGLDKLESVEACDERLPTCILEKPDTEMVNDQIIENLNNSSDAEIVKTKGEEHLWAVSLQNDNGLKDKSEYYANRMDQLLKELRDKYEEAMDLRVRAIVINNAFLMLNNPVDDEKIRKISHYVREKLCPDTLGPVLVMQPSRA